MGDMWACLNCGEELEHDWMPCPNCGWQAPGPWDPAAAEPEPGTPHARFKVFSKRNTWKRYLAVLLFLLLVWGLLNRFWHLR